MSQILLQKVPGYSDYLIIWTLILGFFLLLKLLFIIKGVLRSAFVSEEQQFV